MTHQDPARALWLVIASPFTLVHGLDSAHVDLLMAALGTLSVWVALRGRWVGAILLLVALHGLDYRPSAAEIAAGR